jgi:triacylglycerol lipase
VSWRPLIALLCIGCGSSDGADLARAPTPDAGVDIVDVNVPEIAPAEAGVDAPEKLGPPYPIVLAHGFFGFEELAGLDALTYFFGVRAELAKLGESYVFTPAVDPFNDSTSRGAELAAAIQQILAQTGHAKVNLVGHSQGGLDARVVAHDHPELVASVTTIATPHQGTPVADVILGAVGDPNAQQLIDWFVKQIGYALWDAAGNKTSLWKPLELFSEAGITQFNAQYPDSPGVLYFSLTGRTDLKLNESECAPDESVPFVADWQLEVDTVDPLLSITEAFLDGGLGQPEANDGLVRAADARWGTFLGCIPTDHLDEVGQLLGDGPGLGNQWNHLDFYQALVAYLRSQGL